jgi:hypothetical protein
LFFAETPVFLVEYRLIPRGALPEGQKNSQKLKKKLTSVFMFSKEGVVEVFLCFYGVVADQRRTACGHGKTSAFFPRECGAGWLKQAVLLQAL